MPDALEGARTVLCIDTYETIGALDAWLRTDLVPSLPDGTVLVIAGRHPPGEWRIDPGLSDLLESAHLGELSPDEACELLARRGMDRARCASLAAAAHGHPLALSLVAELPPETLGPEFALSKAPDVIAELVDRFVRAVPSPRHRSALFVCAEALATTEEHLVAAVGGEVAELFDWLRSLSFVQQGPRGLFPHDVARQVLSAELRLRDPNAPPLLHASIRRLLVDRLGATRDRAQQTRLALELLYLHRHNPAFGAVSTHATAPSKGSRSRQATGRRRSSSSGAPSRPPS